MQHPVPASHNLTERQAAFLLPYVQHGDAYRAAIDAGYSEIVARQAKAQILDKPAVAMAIARIARQRLVSGVPQSIATLEWLRDSSTSDKVRLDAATRLLDRAGLVPTKPPDPESEFEQPLHELSLDELRARVERYENEIVGRAKPINATPASDPAINLVD